MPVALAWTLHPVPAPAAIVVLNPFLFNVMSLKQDAAMPTVVPPADVQPLGHAAQEFPTAVPVK